MLAEQNLAIAHALARRYAPANASFYDDLVAAGYLGLVVAESRYDPTRGTSYATYARLYVRAHIIDVIRHRDGMNGRGGRLPAKPRPELVHIDTHDPACTTAGPEDEAIARLELERIIAHAKPHERRTIGHLLAGFNGEETARAEGVSAFSISKRRRELRERCAA